MKEFPFIIDQAFQKGLRPEDTYYNREGFLEVCFNLKPDEGGLIDYEGPTDPFNGAVTVNPPFPQVFRGQQYTLLLDGTTLSEVNTGVSPWTLSAVSTYAVDALTTQKAIPLGGPWHFADLGPSFYAFNGSCTVFRPGLSLLKPGASTTTFVQDGVTIQTGCTHKGRMFVGGFDKDDVWDARWQEIFAEWEAGLELQEMDVMSNSPDANWVMWSSIGGGDFPLWLFHPTTYGQLSLGPPTSSMVIERMKRNEFGFAPLHMNGTVQVLKPLGDNVIAYGDEGIEALVLKGGVVGFQKIADFGVQGRGAVGGNVSGHIFLAEDGEVYELNPSLQLTRRGYKEWFSSFSSVSTSITLNPIKGEFYLCDPSSGYMLRGAGLSEHRDRVTSSLYLGGTYYGLFTSAASTNMRVRTGQFTKQRMALKHINNIQVEYDDITNLKVAVFYRYSPTESFKKLGPISVNPQGVVYPNITALEFKVEFSGTRGSNPRLDRVEVRWSLVDKRAVRGLYS